MNKKADQNNDFDMSKLDEELLENQDPFTLLGDQKSKNELDLKLKKVKFGGYSKGSVQDYVASLKATLTQMKVNLEQQVYDLTAEKATVAEECKYLRAKLKEAEQDYEKAQASMKSLENEYLEYCNGFKDRERQLIDDNNVLKSENDELKIQIEKCQDAMNEINRYKEELENKEMEIMHLNECLDEVNKIKAEECAELKENIELLQNKLNVASEEVNMDIVEQLKIKISELDDKNSNLLTQLTKTKEEFEKVKKENVNKMEEIKQIKENSLKEADIKNETESEIMTYLEKIFADKQNLNVATTNMQQEMLTQPVYQNYQLHRGLDAQNNFRVQQPQPNYSEKDKAYLELEAKFNTLHNHFISTEEENRKSKNEKAVLENMLKKYQQKERDFAFAIQQNSDYKNQINSLQQAVGEILAQMEQQTAEMKAFAKAEDEKRAQMQQAIKERTNLQLRNVELMDEITRLENILERANNEKEELQIALEKEIQTSRIIKVPENSFSKSDDQNYNYNNQFEKNAVGEVYKRADEFEDWINNKKSQLLV